MIDYWMICKQLFNDYPTINQPSCNDYQTIVLCFLNNNDTTIILLHKPRHDHLDHGIAGNWIKQLFSVSEQLYNDWRTTIKLMLNDYGTIMNNCVTVIDLFI